MTGIAKLLVLVNTFVGVGLFAWGLSVAGNRVDYLEKDVGATAKAKAEIDRLTKVIADANAGYVRRRTELASAESLRDVRQAGFAKRLAEARGGRFRTQVGIVDGYGNTFTDLTKTGPDTPDPVDSTKPLQGLKVLQDRFAEETRRIDTLIGGGQPVPEDQWQAIRAGTVTLEQVATLQPDLGINDLRRLHGLLSDLIKRDDTAVFKAREVQLNLTEEAAFLADRRVNVGAELQLLQARERQLDARLKSLTGPK